VYQTQLHRAYQLTVNTNPQSETASTFIYVLHIMTLSNF